MLPEDIYENTLRAYSVSCDDDWATAARHRRAEYIEPANGPECIEVAPNYGDCGLNNVVVTGPRLVRFDLSAVKRVAVKGRVNFEFRASS